MNPDEEIYHNSEIRRKRTKIYMYIFIFICILINFIILLVIIIGNFDKIDNILKIVSYL
jgi:hypothetical protein